MVWFRGCLRLASKFGNIFCIIVRIALNIRKVAIDEWSIGTSEAHERHDTRRYDIRDTVHFRRSLLTTTELPSAGSI